MEAGRVRVAESIAETLEGVMGVPVWLVQNGHGVSRKWRKANAGLVPSDLPGDHGLLPNGVLWTNLDLPDASGQLAVIAGPFRSGSAWVHGSFSSTSAGDSFTTSVPARPITAAFLRAAFAVLPAGIATGTVSDTTMENIRRIGVTCADALGIATTVPQPHSFHRVPPFQQFVEQLASPDQASHGLTETLGRLTATLAGGFHLVDLAGRSLVRPAKYADVCRDVFRKVPECACDCVLSDVTHLWRALLLASEAEQQEPNPLRYVCPVGLTEVFVPLFCQGLAVGAIFTGQLVCDEACAQRVRQCAREHAGLIAVDPHRLVSEIIDGEKVKACETACQGLAGLMAASFGEWCRAENATGLRQDLIAASLGTSLQEVAGTVCSAVKRHVDVSECSVWQLRGERLYMVAATAEFFYVRSGNGTDLERVRTSTLVGSDDAFYELGEGLTGRTAQEIEPLFLPNARSPEAGWVGKLSEVDAQRDVQFLGVPLRRDDRVWGVLRASKYVGATPIRQPDIDLLQDIADELATLFQAKVLSLEAQHHAQTFRFAMRAGAHELRQPLQNINSQSTILVHAARRVREAAARLAEAGRSGVVDPVAMAQALADIERASAEFPPGCANIEEQALRARRQMDNSLLFDTEVICNFEEGRLGQLFQVAEEDFAHRGSPRNVRLVVWDDAKRLPPIRMDGHRISQVITNLLDNAFKYSFKGERVHVHGRRVDGGVQFTVVDRGIGIPKEYLDAIFDPHHRKIVEDRTRFIDGSGMGLPIVKRILDQHGGWVKVTSVPFLDDPARQDPESGHEVTFIVFLPEKLKS